MLLLLLLAESIGARLREERQRLGISQTAFGKIGDVTQKTQVLYENGQRSPNANYLAAIANAGVDILYVVTGKRSVDAQATESPTHGLNNPGYTQGSPKP